MDTAQQQQILPELAEDNLETTNSKLRLQVKCNIDYDDYQEHPNRKQPSCRYVKGRYKLVSKLEQ